MIPNILTTIRLVVIPIFAYFMLFTDNFLVSAGLFLFSGITDVVDGWIARKFNMITDVGSVYDPFVDKLMQITAVICMAARGIVPFWVICCVAAKEVTMIVVGLVLYIKKIVVHSNWYGKATTVFFYTIIFILMIFPEIDYILKTSMLVLLILVMVFAAVAYLIKILGSKSSDICKYKS